MKRAETKTWGAIALGALGVWAGWRALRWARAEDLHRKVVLITGGSRGLGLAMARAFADEGCRLILCGRDDKALAEAAHELGARGVPIWTRRCDISDAEQVQKLVTEAMATFGRIDIVVNNAGIIQVGPIETVSLGDFGRALGTNFWGALHVIDAVLPAMRARRGGHILNVVSLGGEVSVPHLIPYGVAKAALLSLSEGLAAELAKDGIRVSTILPGLMRTGSPVNALFKGDRAKELAWFSAADCLPLVSMSAPRAARRIVSHARSSGGRLVLSWQAKLLRLVHALAPNLTVRLLGLSNRFLPKAPALVDSGSRFAVKGMHVGHVAADGGISPALKALADGFNQFGGHVTPRSSEAVVAPPEPPTHE